MSEAKPAARGMARHARHHTHVDADGALIWLAGIAPSSTGRPRSGR